MGIFDNATSVVINNNEVQSIKITSNNAVIYEKPNSSSDNYVLTLSSNKDILSYYDSESATLTATLTNNNVPVSGETVTFKNGNTVLDTATTDSNGQATYTYASQGAGDVSIKAECMLLQETYELIDAKYHASNSVVDSYGSSYNNDRHLSVLPYPVQLEDKIHFRFKSIPNRTIIGVGSTAGSDLTVEKNGSTYNIWRNVLTNQSNVGSAYAFSTEHDFILYKTTLSEYTNKIAYLYNGNTEINWWQMGSSINRIRVDKIFNDDYEIEIFVL